VGANLVRRLLADGHDVHATERRAGSSWRLEEVRADIRLHEVDLSDVDAIERLVGRVRPDWVFHLAAHGAYSWQNDVQRIFAVNTLGTAALLDAALANEAQAFVHAGSSSEYGLKDHAPGEDEPLAPNSAYAVGKAAATHYCSFVGRRDGARVATLRLYSIYGPWEDPGRLLPTLAFRGLRGELPPLVAPETARDFVHVDDACDAFVRAARVDSLEPGTVLNLGSGRQTTLREIVAIAREVLAVDAEPQWGTTPARSWDTNVWVSNPTRIEAALGWHASTDLSDGFRGLAEWLAADADRLERYATVERR
jgi:dolichol-phosphate mannosyltransferase